MKGIDDLFNSKLAKGFGTQKGNNVLPRDPSNLTKENIKSNLHKIIRFTPSKANDKQNHSLSPMNKSRLKMILESKK